MASPEEYSLPRYITAEEYEDKLPERIMPNQLEKDGLYVWCAKVLLPAMGQEGTIEQYGAYPAKIHRVSGIVIHFSTLTADYSAYTRTFELELPNGLVPTPKVLRPPTITEAYFADMSAFDGLDALLKGLALDATVNTEQYV